MGHLEGVTLVHTMGYSKLGNVEESPGWMIWRGSLAECHFKGVLLRGSTAGVVWRVSPGVGPLEGST